MSMTQTEIDAIYLGKIIAAHNWVDKYMAVYKTTPDDLRNLKLLFDSICKCTPVHFDFLMAIHCKPPQEYADKLDKYMKMLKSIDDRLKENRNKAEREIDDCWELFCKEPKNQENLAGKENTVFLKSKLEFYLSLFGAQKDSKKYKRMQAKIKWLGCQDKIFAVYKCTRYCHIIRL